MNSRKGNPNDEQYTMYEDIAKEVSTYRPSDFRHKTVYCNCDGVKSNFTRYFRENFTKLGLKRLICTSYGGWAMIMDRNGIREFRLEDGDFASEDCRPFLEQADIVVTNPPFSLYRKFIDLVVVRYHKDVLLVGPQNLTTYKNIFPLFRDGVLKSGNTSISKFILPDGTVQRHGNMMWLTTLDVLPKKPLPGIRNYDISDYPKVIGKDAIYIDDIRRIPLGYTGMMAVSLSVFLYDISQYKIFDLDSDLHIEQNPGYTQFKRAYIRLKPVHRLRR